jgi:hypothetical protein
MDGRCVARGIVGGRGRMVLHQWIRPAGPARMWSVFPRPARSLRVKAISRPAGHAAAASCIAVSRACLEETECGANHAGGLPGVTARLPTQLPYGSSRAAHARQTTIHQHVPRHANGARNSRHHATFAGLWHGQSLKQGDPHGCPSAEPPAHAPPDRAGGKNRAGLLRITGLELT